MVAIFSSSGKLYSLLNHSIDFPSRTSSLPALYKHT